MNQPSCCSIRSVIVTVVLSVVSLASRGQLATTQQPAARIAAISSADRVTLSGTHPPRALPANDIGALSGSQQVQGISLVFARSAAQEADLQALLAAQQNPASPLYHQWLTPDQFAARFGMADSDIAKAESWLETQGFSVTGISRSRNRITFSGSAAQVSAAFGTELHQFKAGGETHFAPASDLSLPASLAGVVNTVGNLSDFRPHSHVRIKAAAVAKPQFTSAQSGNHFLTPKDVATIYDINAAYNLGYTGLNQSIAVVGQSEISTTDITNFQTAAGLSTKAPTVILMPNTGTSAVSSGDEVESDLDLEYSGGIAKGATILFVYTGNSPNYGVFDALQYAVDNKVAPIITDSYGDCEPDLSAAEYASLNAVLAQAAAQGQTVIAASGDDGSTDCLADTSLSTATRESLAVDFPSDSQYVTGVGGTEFSAAAVASTNTTYWTSASGSDVIGSAISYIPEQVWNDDSAQFGVSSGGGGVSILTPRPAWQAGVTGITSGSYRLTPDISFASSPDNPGYLYCSSDTASTEITGSCSNGFRDSTNTNLTVAGGTSFAAPIFAGMLAIISQAKNSTGEGVINSTLYNLAASSTTYASVFHDVTSGSNACTAGSTYCSTAGASAYAATTGYDSASGLGSVDFYNLLSAWTVPSSSTAIGTASSTMLTPATATPVSGASDAITINISSGSSTVTTTPTGTVSVSVDGTVVNGSLAIASGVATYNFTSTTIGTHTVSATYSGDTNYAASTASVTLTVASATAKSFALSATAATTAAGSSGTSTITVTPANGYTGTVAFTVTSASNPADVCYTLPNMTVSGSTAVTAALTIYTSSGSCTSSTQPLARKASGAKAQNSHQSSPWTNGPKGTIAFALAGCFIFCFGRRRVRRLGQWTLPLVIATLGIFACGSITGCSGGTSSSSVTASSVFASKGTYTLTITGTDTATATITSTATVTLTVD